MAQLCSLYHWSLETCISCLGHDLQHHARLSSPRSHAAEEGQSVYAHSLGDRIAVPLSFVFFV